VSVLSWNEIRTRASVFAEDWQNKGYEKGQTQLFYQEFFQLFGMSVRRLASFEEPVKKLGHKQGFIDLFWKGMLLVEQKSAGRDLGKAKQQALDYFPGLKDEELPRYLLLCDFQHFELHDLEKGTVTAFALAELSRHVEAFAFIRGDTQSQLIEQEQVTIKAAELVGKLHDLLEEDGFTGEDLQVFLIRTVFCLFADDTGIFDKRASLLALLKNRTTEDGSDLGGWLQRLFETLNTPDNKRQKSLDEELAQFPYINGALFERPARIPSFNSAMRKALISACEFDWKAVSPAIFGSLFQSVMDSRERREQGAHYTSEQHILRLMEPLFLEELNNEFDKICALKRGKSKALQQFHHKLASLTCFDPACGCGNFLVVAYQQIRHLETRLLQEIHKNDNRLHLDVSHLSIIDVDNFYGIEISEFAAKIAQIALWMTDHLCNLELSAAFGQHFARIPLNKSPNIYCADALEINWQSVLPAEQCSYVLGNPPFVGAKYQSTEQRAQVRRIAGLGKSGGTLDYVCAWFIKAAEYAQSTLSPNPSPINGRGALDSARINSPRPLAGVDTLLPSPACGRGAGERVKPKIAFVSTNSITQGEQVAQLWPILFNRYSMEIAFAHRTFAWTSEARGAAHVHVVIIGLCVQGFEPEEKRLFHYQALKGEPVQTTHKKLSPYLIDASTLNNPYLVIKEEPRSLMNYPPLIIGSKPIDDGNYIFTDEQKEVFLQTEPEATPFIRPFIGALEFINGKRRWILALHQAAPQLLRKLPKTLQRVEAVRKFRLASKSKPTQVLANTPNLYHVNVIPEQSFLVIPEVSSENRNCIPIGYLKPPVIPSNKLRVLQDAQLWHFAILTSQIHMAWMRQVTGRMKSDYMYSIGVVYNTFPWPEGLKDNTKAQEKLSELAQNILDARKNHPEATLADLYHNATMPPDLRKAHITLDKAVDKLYQKAPFKDDSERVALLFSRYEALISRMG